MCIFFAFKEKISNKRCSDVLFVIIASIVVLIFLITCLLRLNVVIEYSRQGVNDHFVVSIFILKGLIKYKFEIPKIDTGKKGVKYSSVKETGKNEKDKSKKKEKMGYSDILQKIEKFRNFKCKYDVLIGKALKYLRCKLIIKKLDISITIGTDNAHHTAVLIGLCWSVVGLLTSYIHNKLNLVEKTVNIKPDYMGKKLKVDLFCILSVRIGHIIIVGLISLIHIIKRKFGFVGVKRSVAG